MLDAGMILIVTATELYNEEIEMMLAVTQPQNVLTCFIGESIDTDAKCDLHIAEETDLKAAYEKIYVRMKDEGIL